MTITSLDSLSKASVTAQPNNEEYILNSGDMIVFNPMIRTPANSDGRTLDYRCINVQPEVMREYVRDIMDKLTCHGSHPPFSVKVNLWVPARACIR